MQCCFTGEDVLDHDEVDDDFNDHGMIMAMMMMELVVIVIIKSIMVVRMMVDDVHILCYNFL